MEQVHHRLHQVLLQILGCVDASCEAFFLSIAQVCLIGFRSGEYGGQRMG